MMMVTANTAKISTIKTSTVRHITTNKNTNIINNMEEMDTMMSRKFECFLCFRTQLTISSVATTTPTPTTPTIRTEVIMKAISKGIRMNTIMISITTKALPVSKGMVKDTVDKESVAVMIRRKIRRLSATSQ